MKNKPVLFWFRQDLRLKDNPGLLAAAKAGTVLPVYILDDVNSGDLKMGGASRLWLHHCLKALDQDLEGNLAVFAGDPKKILPDLLQKHKIEAAYWNRCYEPWRIARDKDIKENLREQGIEVETFNGSLLWEPWECLKADRTPYKVFTPFYRRGCLSAPAPREALQKPRNLECHKASGADSIEDLKLLPKLDWAQSVLEGWEPGEAGAAKRLKLFLDKGIEHYKEGRNFPALNSVSKLSPHLHFGEISPNQVWHAAVAAYEKGAADSANLDHFQSELGWREFSHSLLYHFPEIQWKNFQQKFDRFPWQEDEALLKAWQKGQTGYPIVDAGMRELWQTGYMHNRVRMIVGSFLVKNLLIHWHHGERWFWDCLFDADMANNSASWQWVAGSGADAAPYFRIFNPITQGEKFDPEGEYTLKYVPELSKLPKKYLFKPWEAPKEVLDYAGVELGSNYPEPIVNLAGSRQTALMAYERIKG